MKPLTVADFVNPDLCDWVGMPSKRRSGKTLWICRACGAMHKGEGEKPCPAQKAKP